MGDQKELGETMSLQFDPALFTPLTRLENVLNMMGMISKEM